MVKITRVIEMQVAVGIRCLLRGDAGQCQRHQLAAGAIFRPRRQLIMSKCALVTETIAAKSLLILVAATTSNATCSVGTSYNCLALMNSTNTAILGAVLTPSCAPVDPVGGNSMLVGGEWRPTFPRALFLIAQTEYGDRTRSIKMVTRATSWRIRCGPVASRPSV